MVELESPKLVMSAPPPSRESPDVIMVGDNDRNLVREKIGADILSDMKGYFKTSQEKHDEAEVEVFLNTDESNEDSSDSEVEMSLMEARIEYSESLSSESESELFVEIEKQEPAMSSITTAKIARIEAERQQKINEDSLKNDDKVRDVNKETTVHVGTSYEIVETSFVSTEIEDNSVTNREDDDKDISQIVLPKMDDEESTSSDDEKIIEPILDFSMIIKQAEVSKSEPEFESTQLKSLDEGNEVSLKDMPPTPPHSGSSRSSLTGEKKTVSIVDSLASLQGSGSVCAGRDDIVEDAETTEDTELKQFATFEDAHPAHFSIQLAQLMDEMDVAEHEYEEAKSVFRTYITERSKYYKGTVDEILSFYKCCFYLRKALLKSYYRIFFSGRFVKFDDLPLPKEGKPKNHVSRALKQDPILAKLPNSMKAIEHYYTTFPDRNTIMVHKQINNEAIILFTDVISKFLAASQRLEALLAENRLSPDPVNTESYVEILEKIEDEVSVGNLILAGHCNPE